MVYTYVKVKKVQVTFRVRVASVLELRMFLTISPFTRYASVAKKVQPEALSGVYTIIYRIRVR